MSEAAYRVRERRLAFGTGLFSVFADTLVDEHEHIMAADYLVVAPKNRTPEGVTGIVVVPFVEDKIGFVRVFRHAVSQSGWEVPRGFVDAGETPAEAALRELEEEAGLLCDSGNLIDLGCVAPDPGILDAHVKCFMAKNCSASGSILGTELGHSEFRLFTESGIEHLLRSGQIQDSVTLAAYCLSRHRLQLS